MSPFSRGWKHLGTVFRVQTDVFNVSTGELRSADELGAARRALLQPRFINSTVFESCVAGLCLPSDSMHLDDNACEELGACMDARRVCAHDSADIGGICMPTEFCDEAAAEVYPLDCSWSGGQAGEDHSVWRTV